MVLPRACGYTGTNAETKRGGTVLGRLVIGCAVLVTAAMALWFVSAQAIRGVVTEWLAARAEEGWLVSYDEVSVEGFPTAFRTELAALELADPETGWIWTLPRMTLEQQVFRPARVRAVWPAEQGLASPYDRLTIRSETMMSDLDLQPASLYALDLSDTVLGEVTVESGRGWTMTLPEGRLTMMRLPDAAAAYDVSFRATGLVPPAPLQAQLDPGGLLPRAVSTLEYDATMTFDRPWDIRAIEERRPQVTALDLREMQAVWGGLVLNATGELTVGPGGVPDGVVSIRAENWREMVTLAVNAGLLTERMRGTAEGLLGVVAGLSGDPEVIDADLAFENGRAFLGPLPVGPAPRLVLR
jgi:hypothetical protein